MYHNKAKTKSHNLLQMLHGVQVCSRSTQSSSVPESGESADTPVTMAACFHVAHSENQTDWVALVALVDSLVMVQVVNSANFCMFQDCLVHHCVDVSGQGHALMMLQWL